jgi:CRISPR-associated protein Cas7/Csp1
MINSINVSSEYVFENHNVNGDESGKPKEVGGNVYISGQKIKFMIFEKMKELSIKNGLNLNFPAGDMKTYDITNDIVSDLGGYMNTDNLSKRKSPIDVSFAISKEKSNYFDDLFVRFENFSTGNDKEKQRINNKTYSEKDIIPINYRLNVDEVGTTKHYHIDNNIFVKEVSVLRISETEKINRILSFIEATTGLNGLANQSRNAVDNTAKKWFIAFDSVKQFKKYFEMTEKEKSVYLEDLKKRNVIYFEGDCEKNTGLSVNDAFEKCVEYIKNNQNLFLQVKFAKELMGLYSQDKRSKVDGEVKKEKKSKDVKNSKESKEEISE